MGSLQDVGILLLRLTIGVVFACHGAPKVFGPLDGPHGRGRSARLLTSHRLPLPGLLAWGLGVTELVAGSLVLVGLVTRVAAAPLAVVVGLAIPLAKWRQGFVDGWDWPFALAGACVAIVLLGGGSYSLDALLGIPV